MSKREREETIAVRFANGYSLDLTRAQLVYSQTLTTMVGELDTLPEDNGVAFLPLPWNATPMTARFLQDFFDGMQLPTSNLSPALAHSRSVLGQLDSTNLYSVIRRRELLRIIFISDGLDMGEHFLRTLFHDISTGGQNNLKFVLEGIEPIYNATLLFDRDDYPDLIPLATETRDTLGDTRRLNLLGNEDEISLSHLSPALLTKYLYPNYSWLQLINLRTRSKRMYTSITAYLKAYGRRVIGDGNISDADMFEFMCKYDNGRTTKGPPQMLPTTVSDADGKFGLKKRDLEGLPVKVDHRGRKAYDTLELFTRCMQKYGSFENMKEKERKNAERAAKALRTRQRKKKAFVDSLKARISEMETAANDAGFRNVCTLLLEVHPGNIAYSDSLVSTRKKYANLFDDISNGQLINYLDLRAERLAASRNFDTLYAMCMEDGVQFRQFIKREFSESDSE